MPLWFFNKARTPTVATPTFTPIAGTYVGTQTVAINCATPGVTIHYTTDGVTTPTTASPIYSGTISLGVGTTTIQAICVRAGYLNSVVAPATFTVISSGGGSEVVIYVSQPLQVKNLSSVLLVEGDTGPSRAVFLTDAQGVPFTLQDTFTVTYALRRKGSTGSPDVSGTATITAKALGGVQFDFASGLPTEGNYQEQWTVNTGTQIIKFPGEGYVPVEITGRLA